MNCYSRTDLSKNSPVSQICIGLVALLSVPLIGHGQGFSGTMGLGAAKTVVIKQLLPAAVNLNEKRIQIQATAAIQTNGEIVKILETKLRTMIQHDPRFIVDEKNPQTLLKFTVTNSYIEEKHYTVGAGAAAQACTAFTGKLEVSYQALDTANQAPLDSENLVGVIEEKSKAPSVSFRDVLRMNKSGACGTDAKGSMHEAQDTLIDGIVHQMAQRAAPTDEPIMVKLPGKKLETLSRLALAQRWGTLEEEGEKAEKLPRPEDDAYRLYLVALAKEAQAYDIARESSQSEAGKRKDISAEQADADFQKAQRLLDEARKSYKDALQAKPSEKEFQEPDNRMEKAVSVYATIERHKEEYQKFVSTQKAPPPPVRSMSQTSDSKQVESKPAVAGNTPLDQIVKYCQANMDLATISDYIKDPSFLDDAKTSAYKFNFKQIHWR